MTEQKRRRADNPNVSPAAAVASRTLPHSIEAERALLGAVMVNPAMVALLPPALTPESFFRDAHQRIFRAIKGCVERGVAVDLLTLVEELKRRNDLDDVGGPAYLSQLTDGMPRSANAPHYATVVTEHATRRAVIHLANILIGDAYQAEASAADLLATAQRGVVEVSTRDVRGGLVSAASLVASTFEAIERAHHNRETIVGVPSGFADLDVMTAGFHRGDLILLAARPSVGKTALAVNIADFVADSGRRVAFFSLEMTKDQLMMRLVSGRARVDSHRMRTGHLRDADFARVGAALAEIPPTLWIDDTAGLPVSDLKTRARRAAMEMGGPLDLVVVDYLQLVRTRERFENRTQQVTAISGGLKELAKELSVPVMALSQLSRRTEEGRGRRPNLSDLRESGSLEQDADVVLFIYRDDSTDDDDNAIAEVIVGKQRNGPIGTAKLVYMAAWTKFESMATTCGSAGAERGGSDG